MDGGGRRVLVGGLGWPNGVSVDFTSRLVYWVDAKANTLSCVHESGAGARVLLRGLRHPFGLDVFGDFIYWTDWDSKDVKRMRKTDNSSISVVRSNLPGVMSIKVFDPARQQG